MSWFFDFRNALQPLKELREGQAIAAVGSALVAADAYIKVATGPTGMFQLRTSRPAGSRLSEALNQLMGLSGQSLTQPQVSNLQQRLAEFEIVLRSELSIVDAYAVQPKGIYSTNLLAENAELMLPEEIRKTLDRLVVVDVQQAGKCLAFEVCTAAGFHMLRATETVIRAYFKTVVGREPPAKSRAWGSYIRLLEKHGADAKITAMLTQIKDMHRNPVMHPEVSLNINEAIAIFGIATSAIVAMAADKAKRESRGDAQ